MRLIDADKLILNLNNYALLESPSNVESAEDRKISRAVYSTIQNCMKTVDEQPTAFDVDKVVETLMNRFRVVSNDEDLEWNRAIDYAVKIVKGGGAG